MSVDLNGAPEEKPTVPSSSPASPLRISLAWRVTGHLVFGLGFVLACTVPKLVEVGVALMLIGAILPNVALIRAVAASECPAVKPLRARKRAGSLMAAVGGLRWSSSAVSRRIGGTAHGSARRDLGRILDAF